MFDNELRRIAEREGAPMKSVEAPAPVQRKVKAGRQRSGLGDAMLQAKLSVGPAGDRYEREADAVADRVVRALRAPRPTMSPASESAVAPVRRIQRAAHVGVDGGQVDAGTEREVMSAIGSGAPMRPAERTLFGEAFGADFSKVRLHAGPRAAELNGRIQAKAFTTGNDIFFRDGLPDSSTSAGQHLLAHELTHTLQQQGAGGGSGVALQRKNGGGKGGGKKGAATRGGGKRGKGGGKRGGRQPQRAPVKELTAEELAQRAEQARREAEAAAAKQAEAERLAAEAEAERQAQEEAARQERIARGRRVWGALTNRLWATVPQVVRDRKDVKNKPIFTKASTTALMAEPFADLKATLDTGAFGAEDTDEQLLGDVDDLLIEWEAFLWLQVGEKVGTHVPTKAELFAHIGWSTVKGLAWDLKPCGLAPSGYKVHLTVSGNSMAAPQSIVASDPQALQRPPAEIFDKLFMNVELLKRVHCTRESSPKKHLYLGGFNGLNMSILDTDWEGDGMFMRQILQDFRRDTIAKIVDAKAKGWKI